MKLNKSKFIYILKNIKYPSLNKKRTWNTIYNNKTTTFWNNLLWNAILEDSNLIGTSIDRYEFYNFCDYYCNTDDANRIFDSINNKSRCIYLNEFEEYLAKLDNKDYINILKCLNAYNVDIQINSDSDSYPESEYEYEKCSDTETEIKRETEIYLIPEPNTDENYDLLPQPKVEIKNKEDNIFFKKWCHLNNILDKIRKIFNNKLNY